MENGTEIRLKVDIASARSEPVGPHSEVAEAQGMEALRRLARSLEALGIEVEASPDLRGGDAKVVIRYPGTYEAKHMAKRGGRRRGRVPSDSPVYGLTAREALEWLEAHDPSEGASALGVSRPTYYRRLAELRDYAAIYPDSVHWITRDNRH